MVKVYSILKDQSNDNESLPENITNKKPNNTPTRGQVKIEDENKKIIITGKNFEGENFDVEKETNRVIEKIKNINKKKLKLEEITERESKLEKLYKSDKLSELLKQTIKIPENSSINKLLKNNEFLSSRIFSSISKLNLDHEIPFKKFRS